jgi:hypothetical protein
VVYGDGSPCPGGVIEFESTSAAGKGGPVNARGVIQRDGTFRLTTFEPYDGAVPGVHRVMVRQPRLEYEPWEGNPPPKSEIAERFASYETSGLTFTVEEKANQCELVVERP